MTSSSDTERLCQRRISVQGLPSNCHTSELRSVFARFGGITAVHLTRQGHAFVTFDEEDSATASLSMSGCPFRDGRLTVELSQWHDNSSLPVIGAKREMYFPRPFGGRGGQASGGNGNHRSGNGGAGASSSRPRSSGNSGQNSSSSRSNRGQSHRPSLTSIVKVINLQNYQHQPVNPLNLTEEESAQILSLLSFERFPEISGKIFSMLDIVSLFRCRLVSSAWARNIRTFVLDSPSSAHRRRLSWASGSCSIYPLIPSQISQPEDNPESRYRNVLSVKADELEILLALDNGNVEIYDRYSLKLTCVLAGQYSVSPVGLDINSSFILVNYTCAFVNRFRMPMPSSWWSIFCRRSRKLLRVIERESSRSYEDVRLGYEDVLYLVTNSAVHFIEFGAQDLLESDEQLKAGKASSRSSCPNISTHKVVSVHVGDPVECDSLEVVDFDALRIAGVVKRSNFREMSLCVWKKPLIDELSGKSPHLPKIDFMTRLETSFPILENYSGPDFDITKCSCLSIQLRYPLCLLLLSNNRGLFEVLNSCRPYVLFVICDVSTSPSTLKVVTLDCAWMLRMADALVPYDCDTCVLSAKFNNDFLVAGFGSSSDIKDGGIAVWSFSDLLHDGEDEARVFSLPSPVYHWAGWDGHIGGVVDFHLDSWGLVAVNACKHQVTTRCIERFDEAKKDNVLVYDFWNPGKDERREQR